MNPSARAATTKHHRFGNTDIYFFTTLEAGNLKSGVRRVVSPEATFLGLERTILCVFTCSGPHLCVYCVLISSHKDTSQIGLRAYFKLITSSKTLSPNTVTF